MATGRVGDGGIFPVLDPALSLVAGKKLPPVSVSSGDLIPDEAQRRFLTIRYLQSLSKNAEEISSVILMRSDQEIKIKMKSQN